ncbi:MAG: hypothetical protein C0490_02045 [Marivirga sp.]|nr:hypothetical protein [Marivirga sp.]
MYVLHVSVTLFYDQIRKPDGINFSRLCSDNSRIIFLPTHTRCSMNDPPVSFWHMIFWLASRWPFSGVSVASQYPFPGLVLAMGWPFAGLYLATRWLFLATSWLFPAFFQRYA